ncbi:MAG: hypothetical protein II304_02425 [Bacteroidales bacterium]|nr:hypothetical protein [Bacteroidales bacterium]
MSKAKFKTLEHKGPLFPKKYEYKGIYKVNGITLNPMLEKLVWYWAALGEDYKKDKMYTTNARPTIKRWANPELKNLEFPKDYLSVMEKMTADREAEKEAKKLANTKEAREAKKAENEKIKAEYGFGEIDGVKQQLGCYVLEPEGWYIGRGQSPIRGCWKYEILPEDVTINFIGDKSRVPQPPAGHKWKAVVQNTDAFVATYYDIRLGEDVVTLHKKFGFGALSNVKQDADIHKYEKAQNLTKEWSKIEKWIDDGVAAGKQEAVISWLILRTGIRVGGEKSEIFENGTVGASTLKVENVTVNGNILKLKFLGKDSVPYVNEFEVPQEVADAIKKCQAGKKPKDKLFDKASSGTVNAFLAECIPYCTAKLFRTAYGTKLLAETLQQYYLDGKLAKGMPEWKVRSVYDKACLVVSTKLNHQRNVAKNFSEQMDKTDDNIKKAKDAAKKRKEKATEQLKKIAKDIKTAKQVYTGDMLAEKLKKLKEKKYKIAAQVEKSEGRIEKLEANKDLKKATKNIALGTAKGAYSSPLIAASMCKDLDVSPDIIYNKTLQAKFSWAFAPGVVKTTYWKNYPNESPRIK